jgi:murein DD-endopeptidase MepM/ murein hydrolase activator NlpD
MKKRKIHNFLHLRQFGYAFLIAFLSMHLNAFPVYAESNAEDALDNLEEVTKKIEKTQDIISLKQKEQEIINAQIAKIESESTKIEKTIEDNKKEIEDLTSEIDRTKTEIAQKEQHIILQKKILEKFLREKYQNYSEKTKYFTALGIGGTDQSLHKENLSFATSGVGDFVERIHTEQEELKKDQEKFEKKSQRIQDAKYELEQRSNNLEDSKNYKQVLAATASVEEGKYQEKLSKLLQEQLAIQQEISNLSTGQVGTFSLADLPSSNEADFDNPVKKPFVITQSYGKTDFSHNYSTGVHNGIDFVAQGDKSIIAAADGKIKATGDMGRYGYGKWAAVDHGNGLVTLYGHMSSVKVSRGEKIKKGAKIGIMGSTGFSTGTHLHFSVFAESTFGVVESSKVKGVYIPSGSTVNPNIYL